MAIKPTIYKAQLSVADIDHAYYADHALTLARHPSETDERMMIRLVALALQAHQLQTMCSGDGQISFGAGLSDPDEPDVILRDFTGAARLWVEVGQPEDKPLTRACSKADAVVVYCYGHASPVWWKGAQSKLSRLEKLSVWRIDHTLSQELATWAARTMQLSATVQEGALLLSNADGRSLEIEPLRWK
jgi:uncharacterized protein YaeQ